MSEPFTDRQNPPVEHPSWCDPVRCLVAAVQPNSTLVVLEHVGELLGLVTSEGRFTLERVQEIDGYRPDLPLPSFIRFIVQPDGVVEPSVVHLSATDALDLAERLRLLAEQIDGQQ